MLRNIEWITSRTGEITPVAEFDTIVIDGCDVSRATLHNVSCVEELELMVGNRILVSKRHMIIPHVEDNLDRGSFDIEKVVPKTCSWCGQPTRIHISDGSKMLFCDNVDCGLRNIRQIAHFVSKKALDIEGISENIIERFMAMGFLNVNDDTAIINLTVDGKIISVPVQTTYFNGRITKTGVSQVKLFGYNSGVTVLLYYPKTDGFAYNEVNGYMSRTADGLTVLVDINGEGTKLLVKINGMKSLF